MPLRDDSGAGSAAGFPRVLRRSRAIAVDRSTETANAFFALLANKSLKYQIFKQQVDFFSKFGLANFSTDYARPSVRYNETVLGFLKNVKYKKK